jgi:hypothetical protein
MTFKLETDLSKKDLSYLESKYFAYTMDTGVHLFYWDSVFTEWENERYMKTKSKQSRYVRVVKK